MVLGALLGLRFLGCGTLPARCARCGTFGWYCVQAFEAVWIRAGVLERVIAVENGGKEVILSSPGAIVDLQSATVPGL